MIACAYSRSAFYGLDGGQNTEASEQCLSHLGRSSGERLEEAEPST